MYHFSDQQICHHNIYEQRAIFIEHSKRTIAPSAQINKFESNVPTLHPQEPENSAHRFEIAKKTVPIPNKTSVDTSKFSVEERLVTAVWVHERKRTGTSMGQIKNNFRERFGRDPPAKNTLLVWEHKLFTTGTVCDAPRPGRPVNRKCHVDKVAASVHSAPALSLRARALALRLPRTTLRTILRKDISHTLNKAKDVGQKSAGKQQVRRKDKIVKQQVVKPTICARQPLPPPAPPPRYTPSLHSHTQIIYP